MKTMNATKSQPDHASFSDSVIIFSVIITLQALWVFILISLHLLNISTFSSVILKMILGGLESAVFYVGAALDSEEQDYYLFGRVNPSLVISNY